MNDHRDAWEIVRRADHPSVGLVLDSFHTLGRKLDPGTIRRIPGDRIFFVQLADAPLIDMDLLYWSRHFRNMPGEGDLDVVGFMRAVLATGYGGPISLEIFNDQYRSALPRMVARDGHLSLVHLMDRVRRAEPAVAADVPPMSPPTAVEGVEFIEFASGSDDVAELETLLAAAGFTRVGRHVSKDVSVWRQNDVNILVNTQTTGFAHSAYLARGTTVSEIALRVPDAAATIKRALALGAERFTPEVAPGELPIPGIRGVGGSVLRFVDSRSGLDRLWEVDFRIDASVATDGAGLRGVDHVAQTMAYGEMLSWALFYTAIFDATKAPMVDVADPDGLVRSQAIETTGGRLRITLNGADSRRTLAGRFVAEGFGSSVQHVAFGTNDIFATAAALRARSFPVLELGANYYDDLQARFGLAGDLRARLQAANILFDRDDGGEFFQLYARAWGEGMFLEVVERRGDYRGYGAPNAPFRTAAQRRALRRLEIPRA